MHPIVLFSLAVALGASSQPLYGPLGATQGHNPGLQNGEREPLGLVLGQERPVGQGPGSKDSDHKDLGRKDPELDALAKEIIGEVSEIRGLPFEGEVKARYADKRVLLDYLKLTEERVFGKERTKLDERVAQLLGLIPLGMNLAQVQREILASQVGGFYDPLTKTFFVMEGLSVDMVRIIMAHELAHALDDQHFDLASTDQTLKHETDRLYAFHAVAEGSAQVVMSLWLAKNMASLSREALIDFSKQMDLGVLSAAPRLIWQPLFALYNQGQAFLGRRAKPSAFGKADLEDLGYAFENLPDSTEQILHPKKFWDPENRDVPLAVQHACGGLSVGWQVQHTDVLGELVIALLTQSQTRKLTQMSLMGMRFTHKEASGWGGDRLTLLKKRPATETTTEATTEEGETGADLLVLDIFWDLPSDATEFLAAFAGQDSGPSSPGRTVLHASERHVRIVAHTGVSREVALEVASGVRVSLAESGKILPEGDIQPASDPLKSESR